MDAEQAREIYENLDRLSPRLRVKNYTVSEFANAIGMSPTTLYSWIRKGKVWVDDDGMVDIETLKMWLIQNIYFFNPVYMVRRKRWRSRI